MNLSLCLMLKYSYITGTPIDYTNVGWILMISTITAEKLYYDEEIMDTVEFFEETMGIDKKSIVDL